MAQLLIRKVEHELTLALERRAARNNRSLEAEVCEILRIALDKEDEEAAICATPRSPESCSPPTRRLRRAKSSTSKTSRRWLSIRGMLSGCKR